MSVRFATILIATALLAACGKKDAGSDDLAALQALERGNPPVSFERGLSVKVEISTQTKGLDLKAIEKLLVEQGFTVEQTVTESGEEPKYQAKLVATHTSAFKAEDLAGLFGKVRGLTTPEAKFAWTVVQAT